MAHDVPHVSAEGISKRYDGIVALEGVTIDFPRGRIHALVGENGAGKSTLGKIVSGVVVPDEGTVRIGGEPVHLGSPREAIGHGVALVHQEISLVPAMSVLENVLLGSEGARGGVISRRAMTARVRELMQSTGYELNPSAIVGTLPLVDQQKVEILRALSREAHTIVFDEPTARLTQSEAEQLYALMRGLRDDGRAVVFVSHFLEEVLSLSDDVSILKDGRLIRTALAADETVETLILGMLGRSLTSAFPAKRPAAPDAATVLKVTGLTRTGVVEDASFSVAAGEVLGIAGLVGSGRTELARMIFGRDPVHAGTVEVNGERVRLSGPYSAIQAGIAYLPENRKDQALLLGSSVGANMTLPSLGGMASAGVVSPRRERAAVGEMIEKIELRPPDPRRRVGTLSGGNQQKVVFGRWLMAEPAVFIADEPTRGVDVGAKRALYELVTEMAAQNVAVILISSDLEEVMNLAHRILVMHRGRIITELPGDASEDQILTAAFGDDKGVNA